MRQTRLSRTDRLQRAKRFKRALPKLSAEPLHEQAYQSVRRALMGGEFAPGLKLTVRGVGDALGISPSPIRVALGRLVAEGALTLLPNGRIAVPRMNRLRFDELVSMRILLEGTATELAATRITPDELMRLETLCQRLTAASKAGDAREYLRMNYEVKFAIYRASRNDTVFRLIETLWLQFGPFMQNYAKDIRTQYSIDRHEEALAALARGDAAKARRAMEQDIAEGARFLIGIAAFDDGTADA